MFSRWLTSEDIATLDNGGAGVYGDPNVAPWNSGLAAGWHMNDISGGSGGSLNGATVPDFSGNNNSGTIYGSPTLVTSAVAAPQQTIDFPVPAGSLSLGTNTITASYSEDGLGDDAVISNPVTVTVGSPVTLTTDSDSTTLGQPVVLAATLPADATGDVTFEDNGSTSLDTATLSSPTPHNALFLNGSTYVEGTTTNSFPSGTSPACAVAMWIKTSNSTTAPQVMFAAGTWDDDDTESIACGLLGGNNLAMWSTSSPIPAPGGSAGWNRRCDERPVALRRLAGRRRGQSRDLGRWHYGCQRQPRQL